MSRHDWISSLALSAFGVTLFVVLAVSKGLTWSWPAVAVLVVVAVKYPLKRLSARRAHRAGQELRARRAD